ncbi:MAG: hypothetical protein J6A85_06165 [Clostridia bacterium]|nr:hypothetical protein [Clostridia bacterium]
MSKDKKKAKKEKITYIDDGSSIADMSGVPARKSNLFSSNSYKPRSTLKEQFRTYIEACKMMFLPMLVVMGFICVLFLLLWFIF